VEAGGNDDSIDGWKGEGEKKEIRRK